MKTRNSYGGQAAAWAGVLLGTAMPLLVVSWLGLTPIAGWAVGTGLVLNGAIACGLLVRHARVKEGAKVAERDAVARARGQFDALWEASPDDYLLMSAGVILACNGSALRLFGMQHATQLVGQAWAQEGLSPPVQPGGRRSRDIGPELEACALRLASGQDPAMAALPQDFPVMVQAATLSFEWQLHRTEGQTFCAEVVLTSLQTYGSTNCLMMVRDVSARKQVEADLFKAKDMAETSARIKSDFLANMSHEIRTPMNAIIGLSHLALKTGLTARQRDYLDKIEQSGQHLLGIINDILDFSKIESGKLNVENTEFELEKLLDNVTNLIGDRVASKQLELVFDVATDVPIKLLGDSLRLGQILINYANNAVKFTDEGEIHIAVRKLEESPSDVLLRFSVRDTGIGIEPEVLDQLFQGFHQADSSVTRRYGGTGLGLMICKRLAELMGGSVGAQSELGKGSTFWFTARLGKAKRPQRALVPSPDVRGQRVLVVDDNENARTVLSEMLIRMAFEVDVVDSGLTALAALQEAAQGPRPYALIFLDWRMPGMDGSETAKHIMALDLKPAPHCIMVTAYGREQVIKNARFAGVDDVLMKPVNPSLLFDAVMKAVGADTDLHEKMSETPAPSSDALLAGLRGARVLLVEDNEINQMVATELLEQAGFEVEVADNGAVALAKVMGDWFDVVLMDMQMPVMDGLAATREIRRVERLSRLPIISMTANAMQEDRMRCLAAGMNDFVTKPIVPEELWRAMVQWVTPRVRAAHLTEAGIAVPNRSVDAADLLSDSANAPLLPADSGMARSPEPHDRDVVVPTDIVGLDTAQGLRRMLGNRRFYVAMLRKFMDSQKTAMADIGSAIEAHDLASAEYLAHTLKGLSGNLGAHLVYEQAQRLEQVLREGTTLEELRAAHRQATAVFDALMAALQTQLKADVEPALTDGTWSMTPEQQEMRRDVLRQLVQLLKDNDSEVLEHFQLHNALLRAYLRDRYAEVQGALQAFDFEKALQTLAEASQDGGGMSTSPTL